MLVSLDNVTKLFADRMLFSGVNAAVEEGDRIGLVGANGSGKTTLLTIIAGELPIDEGEVAVRSGLSVGFLRQQSGVDTNHTIYEEMRTAFAPLLEAQTKMKTISVEMEQIADHTRDDYKQLAEEYNRLIAFFETNEGYQIDVKINTVLNGMGFGDFDKQTICATLSGGEKTRLALAKLLLQNPGILMLDEPTNHLDFAALQWLEDYLQGYKGALIVVSHDRYFLDKICNRIWDLSILKITAYKGNYSKFTVTREMIYARQQKDYEMQQLEVHKLTDYIARNKARASTAGMARSKEKALARMEPVKAPPRMIPPVRIGFRFEQESTKEVLTVEGLAISVGEGSERKQLCDNLAMTLLRGEKVALVGRNGVGKSSLLRALLGEIPVDSGKMLWGRNLRTSYFEQEQTDLHPFKTVIGEIWDRFPSTYEQDIRNVLGGLQFSGENIHKQVNMLSGGEKARLKFAIMMYEAGNLLIMDEPTNHLDLSAKEALDRALMDYEGTILMISHDRYLLSRVPTRILEMHPDRLVSYNGGYEEYLAASSPQTAAVPSTAPKRPPEETPANRSYRSRKQRAEEVARRGRLIAVEQEISDVEYAIAQRQADLSDPEISSDYQKIAASCEEIERLRVELAERMDEWAALSAAMEEDSRENEE